MNQCRCIKVLETKIKFEAFQASGPKIIFQKHCTWVTNSSDDSDEEGAMVVFLVALEKIHFLCVIIK